MSTDLCSFGFSPISFSEDAEKLRLHTISDAGAMDSLEKMVDGSDSEDSSDESSDAS